MLVHRDYEIKKCSTLGGGNTYHVFNVTGAQMTIEGLRSAVEAREYIDEEIYDGR